MTPTDAKTRAANKKKQDDYGLAICVVVLLVVMYFEVTHDQLVGIVPYLQFMAGLITATLLALEKNLNKKTLSTLAGGPLLVAFVFFAPGKHESNYGQHLLGHALMAIAVYLVIFPLVFRKQLLAAVNGQVALYFSILFWYLLQTDYAAVKGYFPLPVLLLLATGTLVCAFFAVWHVGETAPRWRLGLYLWYLTVLVLISFLQILRLNFSDLVDGVANGFHGGWEMYLGGINATFLAINIGVVVGLFLELVTSFSYLPVTSKKDQLKRGLTGSFGNIRKEAGDLESKYLDRYLNPLQLFFLYVVQGTAFVVNDRVHFMPQILLSFLMVSLASLGLALVHRLKS